MRKQSVRNYKRVSRLCRSELRTVQSMGCIPSKLPEAWSASDMEQTVLRKPHSSEDPRVLRDLGLDSRPTLIISKYGI